MFGQRQQRLGTPGFENATAHVKQRGLSGHHESGCVDDRFHIKVDGGVVAREIDRIWILEVEVRFGVPSVNDVLWNIDQDRARTSGGRDMERILDRLGDVLGPRDQDVVFGHRPGDAGGVSFLERIIADQVRRHLAGEADDGDRVHQRVGQARHRIGRTGAGGHQHDANFAGGARITLRRVHRAAFLAG